VSETVTVSIGGEAIAIPLVQNFTVLERIWPSFVAYVEAKNSVARASAGIGVISGAMIATRAELTVQEIKQRLRVNRADGTDERPGICDAVDKLLVASGLVILGEGEPPAPVEPAAEPTSQTSNTSSLS
jgi:hypothetical protein